MPPLTICCRSHHVHFAVRVPGVYAEFSGCTAFLADASNSAAISIKLPNTTLSISPTDSTPKITTTDLCKTLAMKTVFSSRMQCLKKDSKLERDSRPLEKHSLIEKHCMKFAKSHPTTEWVCTELKMDSRSKVLSQTVFSSAKHWRICLWGHANISEINAERQQVRQGYCKTSMPNKNKSIIHTWPTMMY